MIVITFAIIFFMLGVIMLLSKRSYLRFIQELVWVSFIIGYIFLMIASTMDIVNFTLLSIAMILNIIGLIKTIRSKRNESNEEN